MNTVFKRPLILFASLSLIAASMMVVQALPANQEHEQACDVAHLVAEQAELAAMLATFSEDAETDFDRGLMMLHEVGTGYQNLAAECGFGDHDSDEQAADEHMMDEHMDEDASDEHADDEEPVDFMALAMTIGDPAKGEILFNTYRPEVGFACSICHRTDSPERLVGPGLQGTVSPGHDHAMHGGDMAMDMELEMTEAEMIMDNMRFTDPGGYVRTSILNPGVFVVPGFLDNLMPKTYVEVFTMDEINDLVAYVLTLSN
jgi:hypothetical protein